MAEMPAEIKKQIADLKAREAPEDITVLVSSPWSAQLLIILALWKRTKVDVNAAEASAKNDIWAGAKIDTEGLARASGLSEKEVMRALDMLCDNGLIYPDKTLSKYAKNYIDRKLMDFAI